MEVLITGLNNYLARNITVCLAEAGYHVTCLVRNRLFLDKHMPEKCGVNILEGDLFRGIVPSGLQKKTRVAFCFNQSPIDELDIRCEMDLIALHKYIRLLRSTDCEQLIYVTKLLDDNVDQVKLLLNQSGMAYTIVRISNIIGKESALMNIFAKLAKRRWVVLPKAFLTSQCQPIHLLDVCAYLSKIILNPETYGKVFDIGGKEVMTYQEAFERYLDVAKLKRNTVTLPSLGKPFSNFIGRYIYKFEQDVAAAFTTYMCRDLVTVNDGLSSYYPSIKLASFDVSLRYALELS